MPRTPCSTRSWGRVHRARHSRPRIICSEISTPGPRAFDGDPTTAWTPNFGSQRGRWIEVQLAGPVTVDHVDLTVIADGRHSVPTQFMLQTGDGSRSFTIPQLRDGTQPGTTRTVTVPFDPLTGQRFRLFVDAVRPKFTTVARGAPQIEAPVGIAEVGLAGVPAPSATNSLSTACRTDLLQVNGAPTSVRLVGTAAQARSGLAIEPCSGSLALHAGSNIVRSTPGLDTGLDVDRLVFSSGVDGEATPPTVLGVPIEESGAKVRVVDSSPDSYGLEVRTDGKPFWLVLGESANAGWDATVSEGSVSGSAAGQRIRQWVARHAPRRGNADDGTPVDAAALRLARPRRLGGHDACLCGAGVGRMAPPSGCGRGGRGGIARGSTDVVVAVRLFRNTTVDRATRRSGDRRRDRHGVVLTTVDWSGRRDRDRRRSPCQQRSDCADGWGTTRPRAGADYPLR